MSTHCCAAWASTFPYAVRLFGARSPTLPLKNSIIIPIHIRSGRIRSSSIHIHYSNHSKSKQIGNYHTSAILIVLLSSDVRATFLDKASHAIISPFISVSNSYIYRWLLYSCLFLSIKDLYLSLISKLNWYGTQKDRNGFIVPPKM